MTAAPSTGTAAGRRGDGLARRNPDLSAVRRPALTDVSGYEVFSNGDLGRPHVVAHRLLDAGQLARGREVLGRWLDAYAGEGPQWVHLQWHMLVFELAVSDWQGARDRYCRHIAPVARASEGARTDAPQALLRLCWAAPNGVNVSWADIAQPALARLERDGPPFRVLHDLIAVAGAGELAAIDRWLARHEAGSPTGLVEAARGVRAFAARDDPAAVIMLRRALAEIATWGGSHAQNQLFAEMLRIAERRAAASEPFPGSECLVA